MRKNTKLTEIITIAVVAVLAVVIIIGSRVLTSYDNANASGSEDGTGENAGDDTLPPIDGEEIDIAGYENPDDIVKSAYTIDGGYVVRVAPKGFIGPINMDVTFNEAGDTITSLAVNSHAETEGYGAVISEESFLSEFEGISAPVYKEGEGPAADSSEEGSDDTNTADNSNESDGSLVDGTYIARSEFDHGYQGIVTIIVEGGNITSLVYDAVDESGEYKSYLSSVGEYVMVEGNPTWKEQADLLAEFVIENQNAAGLTVDEEGKTDVISGVSIDISEFINLVEEALEKAAAGEGSETTGDSSTDDASTEEDTTSNTGGSSTGTQIDVISGATFTTDGVIAGLNGAYDFLHEFVLD